MRAQNENFMKEIENLRTALNNLQNQRNVDLGNINNRFTGIDEAIKNKKCYVATGRNAWGVCPFGGWYHGAFKSLTDEQKGMQFHLQFAGILDQDVWTDGHAFLCCN